MLQFLQEEYGRTSSTRLLKEIQEAKKHIPQLQEQLSKATGCTQVKRGCQAALGRILGGWWWSGQAGVAWTGRLHALELTFGVGCRTLWCQSGCGVDFTVGSQLICEKTALRTSASNDVFIICQCNLKYTHEVILGSVKQFCFRF